MSDVDSAKRKSDSKNAKRAATSDQLREEKAKIGRANIVKSANGTLRQEEGELVEALTSEKRPLPAHMRLKMPIDLDGTGKTAASKSKKSALESRQIKGRERIEPQKRQPKPPIPVAARKQPIKGGRPDILQKTPTLPIKSALKLSDRDRKRVVRIQTRVRKIL